jgi:hypothetical protein
MPLKSSTMVAIDPETAEEENNLLDELHQKLHMCSATTLAVP